MKDCISCKGTGKTFMSGFTALNGEVYQDTYYVCASCKGTGNFPEVDKEYILNRITASRGKNKGKLRASMSSNFQDKIEARAYYVWRIARFHGGVDTTLPMTADLGVRGDPYKIELDHLAEQVAINNFGTDLAGTLRWGRALGMI
jgi:hypothetical protein